MISSFKRLWRDRRGNTLAIAGAALPLVLGSAGLASDTIQWTLWKRQLQRAADSAAAAGVYAIASGNTVGNCTDIAGSTYTNPVAYDLKKNNQVNITTTCTVTNPPSTGSFTTDANAVRVALAIQKRLSFSGLFLSSTPTIRATATATIVPSGTYCVVSLETQPVTGINATGSTDVNLGCGMITNSTSMTAAVATGSSDVTASPIAAVGGIPASTHWGTGTVLQPFTLAQDDPFASVSAPSASDFPAGACPSVSVQPNDSATLDPGCYSSLDFKGTVTLNPGTYILDGGSLSTGAQANVSCNGCTFVLTSRSSSSTATIGGVNMNGGANVSLVAPSTGCVRGTAGCYDGIMIYQDRRATADNSQLVNGNSSSKLEGALYFPRADLTFNGTTGMNTNCLQIVSKRVQFTGNSAVNNTCPPASASSAFTGRKIRMVE
ncbi:MAG TPA: pilus assembly protein TadG-related protein [Sphingomicrobium sp.]|nr:pilus assembly protein TadG-related protein [Sphingomicrobium sp.]